MPRSQGGCWKQDKVERIVLTKLDRRHSKVCTVSLLADLGSKPFTTYWKNLESLLVPIDQFFRFVAAIRAELNR
jgi:hypothetical protein